MHHKSCKIGFDEASKTSPVTGSKQWGRPVPICNDCPEGTSHQRSLEKMFDFRLQYVLAVFPTCYMREYTLDDNTDNHHPEG